MVVLLEFIINNITVVSHVCRSVQWILRPHSSWLSTTRLYVTSASIPQWMMGYFSVLHSTKMSKWQVSSVTLFYRGNFFIKWGRSDSIYCSQQRIV